MTMKLEKIELSNFRHHKNFVFTPSDEGITAIKGNSGKGKSTIVDSISWALFGTKPKGVSKNIELYNDKATLPKDRCFVKLYMTIDNRRMLFERKVVSKAGSVECLVSEWSDEEDEYIEKAGPAVSHAESYIKKSLKMNETGFLSSVFIQQNQVDQLIESANAKDDKRRAEVIERLTGVSSVSMSLELAKENLKIVKRTISQIPHDENSLDELEKEKESLSESFIKTEEKLSKVHEKAKKSKEQLKESKLKHQDYNERYHKGSKLKNELNNAIEKKKLIDSQLNEKNEEKKSLKSRMNNLESNGSFSEALSRKNEKSKLVMENYNLLQRGKENLKELEERKEYLEERIENNKKISDKVDELLEKAEKSLSQKKELHSKKSSNFQDIKAEKRSLESAYRTIQDGEGKCPTCLQEVHDLESALNSLDEEIESVDQNIEKINKAISDLSDEISSIERKRDHLEELKNVIAENEKISEKIDQVSEKIGNLSKEKKVLEKEKEVAENIFNSASRAKEFEDSYNIILDKLEKLADDRAKISEVIYFNRKELDSFNFVDYETVERASVLVEKNQEEFTDLSEELFELKTKYSVEKEKISNLKNKIEDEERRNEHYKKLLKEREQSVASVDLLTDFKQDRINMSIPAIESFASDLITRFSDGYFTKLNIDSQFKISVTLADGRERKSGLLSGGETSMAAIALRVAISIMRNFGSSDNLLILDEAVSGQDAVRTELILLAIKEIFKGQIIIIAHNANVDSIVDSTVEL